MAAIPLKQRFVRTLAGSGFAIDSCQSRNTYLFARVSRTEQLGIRIRYLVALAEGRFGDADVAVLQKDAEHHQAALILVGEVNTPPEGVSVLSVDQFFDRLGGQILSILPFEPEFRARLAVLGHNAVPDDLKGRADDLFEQYVHAGLQYLFSGRVIRYGQDRRFEAVPDGVVISGDGPMILYDAKASKDGYDTSSAAIRQFSDYVLEYRARWERTFGELTGFLVISGSFADGREGLADRCSQHYAKCRVPLAFLDTANLGEIVGLLTSRPLFRRALDWNYLFTRVGINAAEVEAQLLARERDAVAPSGGS